MSERETRTDVKTVQPACSISENAGEVLLRIEMPGIDRDGIAIELEKNELVITGKAPPAIENAPDGKYLLRERRQGDYRKTFVIDETIERDTVQATMENGILTLKLTTRESAKPRKIAIS